MRVYALYILLMGLSLYAWKDWFRSLCGLILTTAIVQHSDFPQSLMGIQGLNLWNILFANVVLAWLINRERVGPRWDMPRHITVLLVLWLVVILVGWGRMIFDRGQMAAGTTVTKLVSEQLINTIKWPLLGLLLFDGCRSRRRVRASLVCVLCFLALFALQIAKYLPPGAVLEPGNIMVRMNLTSDIGVSPNGAAKLMSGVPWAMLAVLPLLEKWKHRIVIFGLSAVSVYALALTGGRAGYIACGATLVLLCLLRWRRYLPLIPVVVLLLPIVVPGATARMLDGFGQTDASGEEFADAYEITSGRTEIWSVVIPKIYESPVFGYGRDAMIRIGLYQYLVDKYGESEIAVTHPHNAYLEVLLESGVIGLVIIVGLHTLLWIYSVRLFLDRGDPLYIAVGGVALTLLTSCLVDYMGGQSFYAEQIDVGLWCAIGIMLRLHVTRACLAVEAYAQEAAVPYPSNRGYSLCTPPLGRG